MTIQKSTMFTGQYVAHVKLNGKLLTGIGQSHTEALEDLFALITWTQN
jgi:hypothetical protein